MASIALQLKKAIIEKYGSVNKWIEENDIHSGRFYDFVQNKRDVRLQTLKKWLKTVDKELVLSNKRKG